MVPQDYTLEKLAAGVLQLPHGTYVIVDETVMSEGKVLTCGVPLVCSPGIMLGDVQVDARGVLNLHALRNVCVNGEVGLGIVLRLWPEPPFVDSVTFIRLWFWQLMYDFQFYQMNMPVDLPVLIVSPAKSITPVDFVLPLSDAASAAVAATTTSTGGLCSVSLLSM
jgi:hypothetical protein